MVLRARHYFVVRCRWAILAASALKWLRLRCVGMQVLRGG